MDPPVLQRTQANVPSDEVVYDRYGNSVARLSQLRTSSGVFELTTNSAGQERKAALIDSESSTDDDLLQDYESLVRPEPKSAIKCQNMLSSDTESDCEEIAEALAALSSSPPKPHDFGASLALAGGHIKSPLRPASKRSFGVTSPETSRRQYHSVSSPIIGFGISEEHQRILAEAEKSPKRPVTMPGPSKSPKSSSHSQLSGQSIQSSYPCTWSESPMTHWDSGLQLAQKAGAEQSPGDGRASGYGRVSQLSPRHMARESRNQDEGSQSLKVSAHKPSLELVEEPLESPHPTPAVPIYQGAIEGEDIAPHEPEGPVHLENPDVAPSHLHAYESESQSETVQSKNLEEKIQLSRGIQNQMTFGARMPGGQTRLHSYFSEVPKEKVEETIKEDAKKISEKEAGTLSAIFLSSEQRRILDMVVRERRNVFFTGAAGTGKSVLLRKIIQDLKRKYRKNPNYVAVTASTGLAACNIGGITLHSFAGIGLGTEPVDRLLTKVRRNRKILQRWKDVKVLIIDELSMVDGVLLDKLNELAQRLRRKRELPFGGIQIVMTGDFFQLPPVMKESDDVKFAFEADSWRDIVDDTMVLTQVFRQKDDRFSSMLNEMRRGEMSEETIRTLQSLSRPPKLRDGISPTQLFPRRYEVDKSNQAKLREIRSKTVTYTCDDQYANSEAEQMFNLDNLMAVSTLPLKKGAQVMMIKNVDETLVNGSLGKVLGFMSESSFKLMQDDIAVLPSQEVDVSTSSDDDKDEVIKAEKKKKPSKESSEQIPDDVYGIPSDDEVEMDPQNVNWKRKRARTAMLAHDAKNVGTKYPLVRFYLTDGTTRDVLVQPETWVCQNLEGRDVASRTQVPLILAWALSIHKAQGQTLEYVKINLASTFEKGQAYVAVSRATTLSGLQILGFSKSKVMVHKKVVDFYDSLTSVAPDWQSKENISAEPPRSLLKAPVAKKRPPKRGEPDTSADIRHRHPRRPLNEVGAQNRFGDFSYVQPARPPQSA